MRIPNWLVLFAVVSSISCGIDQGEVIDDQQPAASNDDVPDLDETAAELTGACGSIHAPRVLRGGDDVWSCDHQNRFVMQGDGNLVLYASNPGRAIWSSRTSGHPGAWAQLQGDGNLVVYAPNRTALWSSGTSGHPGAWLAIQTDGNLVIRLAGKVLWNSGTRQCGRLLPGGIMNNGAQLLSCNGKYRLVMQGDANLVLYTTTAPVKAVWSSRTNVDSGGTTANAPMQTDGNFVVYRPGRAVFNTHTNGHPGAWLAVRDVGDLTVFSPSNQALWTTAPSGGGGGGADIPVPASLVSRLDSTPYVEQSCSATTYPGWSHPAKRCSYSAGGISTSVTVADPAPNRVAQWIVDSAELIPSLRALRTSAPSYWEQGLGAIADSVIGASSRIFPLEGGIIENQDGNGYVNYYFLKGVTRSCSGCYCRINSLTRGDYCAYRSGTGAESSSACFNRVGGSGYTDGWGSECMKNHSDAWDSSRNDHFRARAWNIARTMSCATPGSCSPAQVVQAIRSAQ